VRPIRNPTFKRKMSSRRRRTTRSIARKSFELALAAPEVIAHRVVRIWLAANRPSRVDRAEIHRMSAEKVAAFHESWNAVFLEVVRANFQLALSFMWWPWSTAISGRWPTRLPEHGRRVAAAVLSAGLAPIHRRAVANARRLRRRG
jgi:hypothetical protein